MFEEAKGRGRRSADGVRSVSTANLRADSEDDAEAVEREQRRRKAKSTLDLRADEDEGEGGEQGGSKLKAFLSFFRNLRAPKEKQADQVISLVPNGTEGKEEEAGRRRNGKVKEEKEEKEEKMTISERYRNWRGKRAKAKKPDEAEEKEKEEERTEKKKKKKKKPREMVNGAANGVSDEDSEQEVRRRIRRRKESMTRSDTSDFSEDDRKANGNLGAPPLGSLSDLSIDNLELPQEYSNRDLDHRIQTAKSSARKSRKTNSNEAFGHEDSELDSARVPKPRKMHGFDLDLRSSEQDRGDDASDFGSTGRLSTLNRLRQRLHRKSKETTLETFSNADCDERSSRKGKKSKKKHSEEEDAVSIRTERSVKSSVSRSSKTKKKKGKKVREEFDLPSSDSDPEVIVEERTWIEKEAGGKESANVRRPSQTYHVTYLSDSDEDSVIVVDRRRQNFVDEGKRRFRFLRMGRKEKSDSGTRITPLTEGSAVHYSLDLPMLPDEPWDPVEYDPELHNQGEDGEDDFIDVDRLQNLLADPSEKNNVVVIDTRDYNDFLQSRLIFSKHLDEFLDAEAEILSDLCAVYSFFVLYDKNGRTLSLMDSPLSKMYDFLKSGSKSWCIFILDGGFDRVEATAPHLLCQSSKMRRYDLCPSICDAKVLWGNFDDFHITHTVKRYNISHVVCFEGDVDAQLPGSVDSLLLKADADSLKLYDHFEELFKFLFLGRNENRPPLKLLLTCTAADNRCSAAVIAYMMFRHHWTLQDAFTHVATRRRSVQLGKNNLKALQKLEKRLFGKSITKSPPKLKEAKRPEDKKKKEEDNGIDEEKFSDGESTSWRRPEKKKRTKRRGKVPKDGSDQEPQFSDDDEKGRRGKREKKTKKKDDNSDSELKFSDDEKERKGRKSRKKSMDLASEVPPSPVPPPRKLPFRRRSRHSEEAEEKEEEAEKRKKKERKPSRTKGRRRSVKEVEAEANQVQEFVFDPEQDSAEEKEEEEEDVRKPRPKKRSGLLRLKKNASEGIEAALRS